MNRTDLRPQALVVIATVAAAFCGVLTYLSISTSWGWVIVVLQAAGSGAIFALRAIPEAAAPSSTADVKVPAKKAETSPPAPCRCARYHRQGAAEEAVAYLHLYRKAVKEGSPHGSDRWRWFDEATRDCLRVMLGREPTGAEIKAVNADTVKTVLRRV